MAPPYVHADISREEAEERVTSMGSQNGIFLIRETGGKSMFCIIFKGKPTHHKITTDDDGFLLVNGKKYGQAKTNKEVRQTRSHKLLARRALHTLPCIARTLLCVAQAH